MSYDNNPEICAREILKELKVQIPCDLDIIIEQLSIGYMEKPLSLGIDGIAVTVGNNFGILVNNNITYESRKRFTKAHELGHCSIPSHFGHQYECKSSNIDAFDGRKDIKEYEADRFAAELLMPESIFKQDVDKIYPTIAKIEGLANKYCTSIIATAIRLIKYTLEPCALVLMQDKVVRWSIPSCSFKYTIRSCPLDCYAFDILETGEKYACDALESRFWLTNWSSEYIQEDVINFTNLNKQLILLKPSE